MGTESFLNRPVGDLMLTVDALATERPVRAISLEELTQDVPILVVTTSLSAACQGAGGLLAACFESFGAQVVLAYDNAGSFDAETNVNGCSQFTAGLRMLAALGCDAPERCLSTIDVQPGERNGADQPDLAGTLAAALRSSGARSMIIPQIDRDDPCEAALIRAARQLCSRDRNLQLWRCCTLPQLPDERTSGSDDQSVGLRLLDIRPWQDAKCAAVRCDDHFMPTERFWQALIRLPQRH